MPDAPGLELIAQELNESFDGSVLSTYYEHDLVGCVLVTRIGRELGTVRAVEGGGGTTRLVAGSGRGEIQVPLVHDICVRIDIEEKRIVIEPPEGLLDLNA